MRTSCAYGTSRGEISLFPVVPRFGMDCGSDVRDLAWHPTEEWVAVSSKKGEVQILDSVSGKLVATPVEPRSVAEWAPGVAWSPDGAILARAMKEEVVLVDTHSWRELRRLTDPEAGSTIAWSPDGMRLAIGGSRLTFWSRNGETELGAFPRSSDGVGRFDWSSDGRLIAYGVRETAVQIIDVETQVTHEIRGHTDKTWRVHWDPRPGSRRLGTAGRDGIPRIWDASHRQDDSRLDAVEPCAVAWSRDGRFIALAAGADSAGSIVVRDDVHGDGSRETYRSRTGSPRWARLQPEWPPPGDRRV